MAGKQKKELEDHDIIVAKDGTEYAIGTKKNQRTLWS
jgi:hypothetical protein